GNRGTGEGEEGGMDVEERSQTIDEGSGPAEAQDRDGVEAVLAEGEVLEVAVVAGHHERLVLSQALHQTVEEFVQDLQHLARGLEVPRVAHLVGAEVLEEGEVDTAGELEEDLRRLPG